jgi:hypothetical protein
MELNLILSLAFTISIYAVGIILFCTLIFIYLSNPFRRLTIVRSIFSSELEGDDLILYQNAPLKVRTSPFWRLFAWIKSGTHIIKNVLFRVNPIPGNSVEEIARELHCIRFNPRYPFLISGDHFSVFYPRNLGIFYYPTLDPRIGFDEQDYLNREKKYSQSVAYALEAFSQAGYVATTLVPTGRRAVTPIQIFAYASDSLYGVLHGLAVMQDPKRIAEIYPFHSGTIFRSHTAKAAEQLLSTYHKQLKQLYESYIHIVFDTKTGFIKQHLRLSSTLDTKIRSSSFYDNVICWQTVRLAGELGIILEDREWLKSYKKRILHAFWYEDGGYFLDDLSDETQECKWYASDWLIALMTGFIHPSKKTELDYFTRSIAYIRDNNLDKPFPLRVVGSYTKTRDHGWVRTFVPNYQDNAIWSNWGVQYIKALVLTATATAELSYLKDAERAVKVYRDNILKYQGYPEVYSGATGEILENAFYRSILRTGWIIDFEHAEALLYNTTI